MQGHLLVNFSVCHVVFRTLKVNIFLSILFLNISYCQEQKHVACSYTTGKTLSNSLDTAVNRICWKMWSLKAQCYTNAGELWGTKSHIYESWKVAQVTWLLYVSYLIAIKNTRHLMAPNSRTPWLAPLLNMQFVCWLSDWLSWLKFFMLFLLISGK